MEPWTPFVRLSWVLLDSLDGMVLFFSRDAGRWGWWEEGWGFLVLTYA